jgi:hypothetical protein
MNSPALCTLQHEGRRETKLVVADTVQQAMDLDHMEAAPATTNFFPSYHNEQ